MTEKRYSRATWKPLPEYNKQAIIKPTQVIIHSIVGSAQGCYNYFRDSTGIESHFILPKQGVPWQIMDLDRRADANNEANRRPDGTGALSMETEDNRDPDNDPWTKSQLDEIVAFIRWAITTYNIPRRLCRNGSDPGFGYHSMHGAPSAWTTARGKTCPGRIRIKQWNDIIVPAVLADPTSKSTNDNNTEEDEDMAQTKAWFRAQPGDKTGHCYRICGTTATWFSTHEEIQNASYFGVKWAGGTEANSMIDPVMWKSLAVLNGPLQNVNRALLDDEAKILAAISGVVAKIDGANKTPADADKVAVAVMAKLRETLNK